MAKYNQFGELKISRIQSKVILDFLGIPFREQGKSVAENRARLDLERQNNREEYDRAIDLIIHHKAPTSIEVRSETFYHEWSELLATYFGEGQENAEKSLGEKVTEICKALDTKANDMWNVLDDEVKAAIERETQKFQTIAIKIGNKKAIKVDGILHEDFPRIVQLAQQRKNIMLVGPSGCGKTFLVGQLAKHLELDYSSQSCTAGMSESMLNGWLLPIGNDGKFAYVSSEFVRIYENGGVFLLDEMDASDPNVLVFINQALGNDFFVLPQRYENPKVIKHKDFVCVGACNTFGTGADALYHGRNALDAATLDRFRIGSVHMDYSEAIEAEYVMPEVLLWGQSMRSSIKSRKMIKIMSTRFMIDATDMICQQDWTMEDVKQSYFADWSEEEIRMVGGAS